jgi:hypothetical protein
MAGKNVHGGGYGVVGSLAAVFTSDLLPDCVLTAQFSATGATNAVPTPSGVGSGYLIAAPTSGAPTAATVVLQGSLDGGLTWVTIPPPAAVGGGLVKYTQIRLNCTALTGGTSPTIYVTALAGS